MLQVLLDLWFGYFVQLNFFYLYKAPKIYYFGFYEIGVDLILKLADDIMSVLMGVFERPGLGMTILLT